MLLCFKCIKQKSITPLFRHLKPAEWKQAPEAALIKADNLEAGVADDLNYVDIVSPPSPADNEGLPSEHSGCSLHASMHSQAMGSDTGYPSFLLATI